MTERYYFETRSDYPNGVNKRVSTLHNFEQRLRQKAIEIRQRDAGDPTIASLNLTVSMLDSCIAADLEIASVSRSTTLRLPMSARTTRSRRDNLKATISALSKQLEHFETSAA